MHGAGATDRHSTGRAEGESMVDVFQNVIQPFQDGHGGLQGESVDLKKRLGIFIRIKSLDFVGNLVQFLIFPLFRLVS